jgi:hypothetical protein
MSETRRNQSSDEQIEKSEIQHQRVVIENSHGEKLVGVLHDTGSTETVVICHGFRSSKVFFFVPFSSFSTSFDSHFRFHEI